MSPFQFQPQNLFQVDPAQRKIEEANVGIWSCLEASENLFTGTPRWPDCVSLWDQERTRILAGYTQEVAHPGWVHARKTTVAWSGLSDVFERAPLLLLRQTARDAQALLGMQACLLLRRGVPERGVKKAQEDLRAAAASERRG